MKTFLAILKWIGVILVIVLLGWLAFAFKMNVGGLISKILGLDKKRKGAVLNEEGEVVGEQVTIIRDMNPLRDTNVVVLDSGEEIQLPEGVKDTDVTRVVKVGSEYHVEKRHTSLTDVFDSE